MYVYSITTAYETYTFREIDFDMSYMTHDKKFTKKEFIEMCNNVNRVLMQEMGMN